MLSRFCFGSDFVCLNAVGCPKPKHVFVWPSTIWLFQLNLNGIIVVVAANPLTFVVCRHVPGPKLGKSGAGIK